MKIEQRAVFPILLLTQALATLGISSPQFQLKSGARQVHLLELFSSEGCSSCPPADAWLAGLKSQPDLWTRFVPIEFHVDYWNRLGWTDRFSKAQFTGRQNAYAREWGKESVYTPGFVLDGAEVGRPNRLDAPTAEVGVLSAREMSPNQYEIRFVPAKGVEATGWVVHGAILGNGLESQVASGENSGRTLKHEFVALTLQEGLLGARDGGFMGRLELAAPAVGAAKSKSLSIAFWVSRSGHSAPVQAVGGNLK